MLMPHKEEMFQIDAGMDLAVEAVVGQAEPGEAGQHA